MDVVDLLDPVVLLQRHRVEAAHLTHHLERRLEPAERFDSRARTNELVVVEDDVVVDVLDGDDAVRETAIGLRCGSLLLGARRVGVDVVAAEVLDRRDQVGADPLGNEVGVEVRLGVHRPGAAVGAHRHARHRLDSAGEDEVLEAGADLLSGDVDGLEAGGAEAVDLDAGDRVGQPRLDRGGLGDVSTLVTDRGDASEHDVVDAVGIE